MRPTTIDLVSARLSAAADAVLIAVAVLFLVSARWANAAQTPYTGTPITVPATWAAADFDHGGEGVAYHDNTPGNADGQYRTTEDVDMIPSTDSAGGTYVVHNFESGEWLEYTISVPTAGFYYVVARASNQNWSPAPKFRIEIEGRGDVTGDITVPNTQSWDIFTWVGSNAVYLNAGTQVLRFVSSQQYFGLNTISVGPAANPSPYTGTPIAVPASWAAADFDNGGEGVAYHDNTPGNAGGQYRTSENVDTIPSTDSGGGTYVVNNFENGEWLRYTISVPTAGFYYVVVRASNQNWSPAPKFRIEVEGRGDVTGDITVPNTQSWDTFTWVVSEGVYLNAGTQVLRIVSVQQYFGLNTISIVTGANSSPYTGTPIAVPATWEAENFDHGGEWVAYHDNTPGNAGGQYRPSEDVDLAPSTDPAGGGYIVNNFENGEWLVYTVQVPSNGEYDMAIRASNNNWSPTPRFHIEIDGTSATGSVVVPNTASWDTFQWVTIPSVWLPAGVHVLKIVSDQQYFGLNEIRLTSTAPQPSNLLFWSHFENATTLSAPTDCYATGCWQSVTGTDDSTGDAWPPPVWQTGSIGHFQLHADAPINSTTVSNYIVNRLESGTGRNGSQSLYSEIKQSGCCGTSYQLGGSTQDPYVLEPPRGGVQGDLYLSYWLKFQPELDTLMGECGPNIASHWRMAFEWKTAGDYRVGVQVRKDRDPNSCAFIGSPYFHISADNNANCSAQLPAGSCLPPPNNTWAPASNTWDADSSVAVPIGQWFKLEVFWHRSSGNDGRVWMAVDGQAIVNHVGPNTGVYDKPINRIFIDPLYTSTKYPVFEWLDDLQIWQGFPTAAPGDLWYDPPYAAH